MKIITYHNDKDVHFQSQNLAGLSLCGKDALSWHNSRRLVTCKKCINKSKEHRMTKQPEKHTLQPEPQRICQSSIACSSPIDYCKGKLHPSGKPCPYYVEPEPTCPECGHPSHKGRCYHREAVTAGKCDCELHTPTEPIKPKIIPDDVNNLPCDHDIDCQCGYCQPIKPEKHCNRCGGTGIVDSPSHWDAKRVMCPKCNGTGKANPTTPDFAKKCPECGHPIMTHNRYGCQARYPVCSCRIRRFELEHIPDTDYKKERASHKKPVKIEINSKVPSKWRFVDLETGDIWKWDEGNNTFMRATLK